MTYAQLIDQIKTEGRVKDDDAFTSIAISLVNESFKEAVESQRPFELRDEIPLTLVSGVGSIPLPDNFFIHHQFFYGVPDGREYALTDQDKAISPAPRGLYGKPKSFQVQEGLVVVLAPADMISSGDSLRMIYYLAPPEITEATINDEVAIPRLEPFLIRFAIRRARMFHSDDVQVAQMLSQDVGAAAQAYTKDSPERESKTGA